MELLAVATVLVAFVLMFIDELGLRPFASTSAIAEKSSTPELPASIDPTTAAQLLKVEKIRKQATAFMNSKDFAECLLLLHRGIDIVEQCLGKNAPESAPIIFDIAKTHRLMGEPDKAADFYQLLITLSSHQLPGALELPCVSHVSWLLEYARRSTAETRMPVAKTALRLTHKILGPEHLMMSDVLKVIAKYKEATNQLEAARILYARVLAIRKATYAPASEELCDTLETLASVCKSLKRLDESEDFLKEAVLIRAKYGKTTDYAAACFQLLWIHYLQKRYLEIDAEAREYAQLLTDRYASPGEMFGQVLRDLAEHYWKQENYVSTRWIYDYLLTHRVGDYEDRQLAQKRLAIANLLD